MAEIESQLPVARSSVGGTLIALPGTGIDGAETSEQPPSPLDRYPPPYDLTSDMLFVAAICPVTPLRRTFPELPFLSVAGKALLVMWFSRVKEICYSSEGDEKHCIGAVGTVLYNELNVVTLLRRRAFFVPGIYATSNLTIRVGQCYGMPKQPTAMSVQVDENHADSTVVDGSRRSVLRARLIGSGRLAARVISCAWPWRSWPARFPSGGSVRPVVLATPRVQVALVREGQLALEAEWLPQAVGLLPVGLYVPNLMMRLPAP